MVVTLTGENAFMVRRELQKLLKAFVEVHTDVAAERLDGEEASWERIQEALFGLPFLTSKKLVILRQPSANKQFVEQVEKLVGGLPETTEVVLWEPKLDRRSSYYKFLKKATDFREFGELDGDALPKWLTEAATEKGGVLKLAEARFLMERVGLSQQLLENELEKLVLYAPEITHENIELLTERAPQSSIFELIEAAFSGDVRRALELYQDQRAQKVEPAQIIAMLTWQLRVLAFLKTAGGRSVGDIAKEARLNPFVARKGQSTAARLSLRRLTDLVSELLEIDARSKREQIDLDEALQNYVMRLTN